MTPGFTAEQALKATRGSYRTQGVHGGGGGIGYMVVPQASAASGVYLGTFCFRGVLTVVLGDVDDNGVVVNWHPVDEIGSC
jgi:hypothetical protein